ncbi:hypothetical protein BH09PLA1_BH09PLA1_35640 [soil metagenome]
MRFAGLGVLALLVVVAIIMLLYAQNTIPAVQKGQEAREQAEQIAGVDPSGGRVSDSYDLATIMDGGKVRGLKVTRISSTSPMKTYYGLQKDDLIVEYGAAGSMMKVRETDDAELAKAMVADAYQRHQALLVLRNGAPVRLDGEEKKSAPAAPSGSDSVQDQLNKIKTPR